MTLSVLGGHFPIATCKPFQVTYHLAAFLSLKNLRYYRVFSPRGMPAPGLPWGLDFNSHTNPIPTEKPVRIPTGSPYQQNPESSIPIGPTYPVHTVFFLDAYFCSLACILSVVYVLYSTA